MKELQWSLQYFATQTTQSPGLSDEMRTFYEKRLIDLAEPRLIHAQFADKYHIPKHGGKQIEFRKYSPLGKAVTPLVEGVTPEGNSLTVSAVTATLNQYGDWIGLSDMLEMTAIDNNVVQATKLLGNQAGRTLDTVLREELAGGTNVYFAPKVAGDTVTEVTGRAGLDMTAKLTPDLIFRVAAHLKTMNADPIDDCFVAIIHPYAAYDLMRNPEWIDVYKYQSAENIYQGEIGKLGGVRFVETSEAKIWKDNTCPLDGADRLAVFGTLVVAAHAYGDTELEGGGLQHIVKQLGYADELNQRSACGWKAAKVARRLVEEYMVRIESCSAFSKTADAN